MKDGETSFLTPILSAIAGLATLATVLSPIFAPEELFKNVFVEDASLTFLSVIGFLTSVLLLWFFMSRNASFLFSNTQNPAKSRFIGIVLFVSVAIIFYITKLAFDAQTLNKEVAISLQAVCFIGGFGLLSANIGMLFRDTYDQYTWQARSNRRVRTVREAILESGQVHVDLKILMLRQYQPGEGDPFDWFNVEEVVFETNTRTYRAVVSLDQKAVLLCSEIPNDGEEDGHNTSDAAA